MSPGHARRPKYYGRRPLVRRRRRVNRRAMLRAALFLLLLGGMGTAAYFALTSPKLIVRNVKVIGAEGPDLSRRLARSAKPVCLGRNILLVNKGKIVRLALREPEVERVYAIRSFPATIKLKIRRKSACAVLRTTEAAYLIDAKGIPFLKVSAPPRRTLPLIMLEGPARVRLGRPCGGRVETALKCICAGASLGLRIRKISVDQAGELCLNVVDDFYVRLGGPELISTKLRTLGKMMDGSPELFSRIVYVDLSCPKAPAVRLKSVMRATP